MAANQTTTQPTKSKSGNAAKPAAIDVRTKNKKQIGHKSVRPWYPAPPVGVPRPTQSTKRQKKVLKDAIYGVSAISLKKLARQGGVKRVATDVVPYTRKVIKEYLREILEKAVMYTNHFDRKTVTLEDVVHALKELKGKSIIGFNGN